MTYFDRFTPFPKFDCKYGAPMGRHSEKLDPDTSIGELCVSRPQGEYDCGGAYWGDGGKEGPVYAVWRRGHGRDGVACVRAHSKGDAALKALEA